MKFPFLFLIAILFVSSCHQKRSNHEPMVTAAADSLIQVSYTSNQIKTDSALFAKPEQLGDLDDNSLSESSGVAASHQNPGYLWTDEDSGNPAEVQLINKAGEVAGRYTLAGITNIDWEDIAVGPGPMPGKSYVYVAEIGDNSSQRPTKTIYRFPEPTLKKNESTVLETISAFDSIRLQFPDGPGNAEAILIDPGTLDLYILSKEKNCALYKASYPQSLTSTTLMERLLIMPLGNVTAAAISPEGNEILVRSYHQLWYFTRQKGESIVDALKRAPRLLPLADEPQGEAIGWATDGAGFYTTSERTFFFAQPLYFYRRN
ncbi:hypothetical protein [Fibrella forsythiae]|uniref:PE-PGRS family protein n=1 Tax=Fibrella forsythiae TaxID=2817061 RepID=A0ABS3JQG5_9BACT|nr:hypothetical protein [Fibrella forsythiae]MBO0951616.1 hypothetical protein [Fibrella forsythiae]